MKTKHFFLTLIILNMMVFSSQLTAQDDKAKRKSPMETITTKVGNNTVTITYSRPSVNGRTVWGSLVPYNEIWRTGANEATTIEFSEAVTLGGKTVAAGKYALFTIPTADTWTIILNSDAKQWGAYNYKQDKDVVRWTVKPTSTDFTEMFTITASDKGTISLMWEKVKVEFSI